MIHLICPNPAIDRTLLIDNFHAKTPNRPQQVKDYPGGKSFNVAYAVNYATAEDVTVHTILGGKYGEYVTELANAKKIKVKSIQAPQDTRICSIIMDTTSATVFPIYERGFALTLELLDQFTQSLITSVHDNDIIAFSGSLMQGMPNDYIAQVYHLLHKQGLKNVKFFVDTSANALVEAYKIIPDMIKINDEEILDLFPNEKLINIDDYKNLLQTKVNKQIPYFIITLGPKGVIARMHDKIFYISVHPIRAKNPIASGDFFFGSLIKSIINQIPEQEALCNAVAFSTANCLNWFPEVSEEDLNYIKTTTTIEEL